MVIWELVFYKSECKYKNTWSPLQISVLIFQLINYEVLISTHIIRPCKIYQQKTVTITWKYKDEESTDSSDNTDHFANVWNKHCDEKSDCDPGCGQGNTGPALVRPGHCCVFVSSPQQRILNHRSTDVSINQYTVWARNYSPNKHKTQSAANLPSKTMMG